MITEDYISYEVAKLLKEKGFPQEYDKYHSMVYNEEDYEDEYEVQRMVVETKLVKAGTLSSYPVGVPEPKCYCPTHQMAMKWLREKYNLFIWIGLRRPNMGLPYCYELHSISTGEVIHIGGFNFGSYEQAVEAALKYSLENLIEL